MNYLLRPQIWPSFRASSGVEPCDVPFRYASGPIPRYRGMVARWQNHLCGLATAIQETSGQGRGILRSFVPPSAGLRMTVPPFAEPVLPVPSVVSGSLSKGSKWQGV